MAKHWDPTAGVFVDDVPQASEMNRPRTETPVPSLGTAPLDSKEDPATGPAPSVSSIPVPEVGS